MSTILEVVEGWTQELGPFTLRIDGDPFPGGLDGFTVALVLKGKTGTVVTADTRADDDQSANPGQVFYTPATDDLVAAESPYSMHWKVTDGNGKVVFFPHTKGDRLIVNAT